MRLGHDGAVHVLAGAETNGVEQHEWQGNGAPGEQFVNGGPPGRQQQRLGGPRPGRGPQQRRAHNDPIKDLGKLSHACASSPEASACWGSFQLVTTCQSLSGACLAGGSNDHHSSTHWSRGNPCILQEGRNKSTRIYRTYRDIAIVSSRLHKRVTSCKAD